MKLLILDAMGMMINRRRVYGDGGSSPVDYSQMYMTIVSKVDNNVIGWKASVSSVTKTISVSVDNGATWTAYTSSTEGTTLATLSSGDRLLVKGTNSGYAGSTSNYNSFTSTGGFELEGNIMSLIGGDNFRTLTILSGNRNFISLFYGCANLLNAENLVLAFNSTAFDSCYSMFRDCTRLISAPKSLPSIIGQRSCSLMFGGCSSLVNAPELPATTISANCYELMFSGCTSLVTAPLLPATNLIGSCYNSMFRGCTSLVTAPLLPATTLAQNCYNSMFRGCTSLITAPLLPATTLVQGCYASMFRDCSSLLSMICLATDISATNALNYWSSGVSATGTFTKAASMTSWPSGRNGIPDGWTVIDYSE